MNRKYPKAKDIPNLWVHVMYQNRYWLPVDSFKAFLKETQETPHALIVGEVPESRFITETPPGAILVEDITDERWKRSIVRFFWGKTRRICRGQVRMWMGEDIQGRKGAKEEMDKWDALVRDRKLRKVWFYELPLVQVLTVDKT